MYGCAMPPSVQLHDANIRSTKAWNQLYILICLSVLYIKTWQISLFR